MTSKMFHFLPALDDEMHLLFPSPPQQASEPDKSCVKELLPPAETCATSMGLNCPMPAQVGMRPSPGHLLQRDNASQQSQHGW